MTQEHVKFGGPRRLVAVVKSERYSTCYHPTGTYSYILTLECGCHRARKGSEAIPKRCWCDCQP